MEQVVVLDDLLRHLDALALAHLAGTRYHDGTPEAQAHAAGFLAGLRAVALHYGGTLQVPEPELVRNVGAHGALYNR